MSQFNFSRFIVSDGTHDSLYINGEFRQEWNHTTHPPHKVPVQTPNTPKEIIPTSADTVGLPNLPNEVTTKILYDCSGRDLLTLKQVNSHMAELCHNQNLWHDKLKRDYPRNMTEPVYSRDQFTTVKHRPILPEEAEEKYLKVHRVATRKWKRLNNLRVPVSYQMFRDWQQMKPVNCLPNKK